MPDKTFKLSSVVYQYQYRFLRRSLFQLKHPINSFGIEGIGTQPIEAAGGESDNPALLDEDDGTLNYFGLGMFMTNFINFQFFSLFSQLDGPFPV